MAGFFIAVGGTGQSVATSYSRIASLIPWTPAAHIFHMDRDVNARFTDMVDSHFIDPLPPGAGATIGSHFTDPRSQIFCTDVLDALLTSKEQATPVLSGMYGHPPVGAAMILDNMSNEDVGGLTEVLDGDSGSTRAYLRDGSEHIVVVCGSAMGGTGAGGVPSVTQYIDRALGPQRSKVSLYVLYFLQHFGLRPHSTVGSKATDSDIEDEQIANHQIMTNARSGMSYLTDRIADGTNGCLLFGLDVPPTRPYQKVGSQTEQLQPLHVLAAMYAQFLFCGGNLPGRHNAHAVALDVRGGHSVSKDIGLGWWLGENRQISLDQLMQFGLVCSQFLRRMARLLDAPGEFAFVSSVPRQIDGILDQLVRDTKDRRGAVKRNLASKLQNEASRIDLAVEHLRSLSDDQIPFSIALRGELDGTDYRRQLKRPLAFMRRWSSQIPSADFANRSYDGAFDVLTNALYRAVDRRFFNSDFGLAGAR